MKKLPSNSCSNNARAKVHRFAFVIVVLAVVWNFSLPNTFADSLQLVETDANLTVSYGEKIVLVYNKQSPQLPDGMDPVYQRSGFIHPVNSPNGKTVTDAFPKDHPHQDGIFSAWVKTSYGDRSLDFWNLSGRTGRVVHDRVVSKFQDDRSVGFEVDMIHQAVGPPNMDILRERWKVTVYKPSDGYNCFDIESLQEAITDTSLVVQQHHYGGMALRGVSRWLRSTDKDLTTDREIAFEPNSLLNNLGQDRKTGNHTPATWVALTGTIDQEDVMIAVLSHPGNLRAPQPARMHDTKPYFCFTPCVTEAFEISQAKPLRAMYRYLVTDASPDPAHIEKRSQEMPKTFEPKENVAVDSPKRSAKDSADIPSAALLTIDRLFTKKEFQPDELGSVVWSRKSSSYYALDRTKDKKKEDGRDLQKFDSATGKAEVIVSAKEWIPSGESKPLAIDSFEFSKDESKLLVFTNSQKVWRRKTRGDYWLFDLKSRELKKLGDDGAPATMMFAKFSPDGSHMSFVREQNIYVQNLDDETIVSLTKDGSTTRINGTSDWVNEEELDLRDGYRWSPDSKSIAFWQFDTSDVQEFKLIDNTHGVYPRIISFPYPKVGETNSSTRLGVVSFDGNDLKWLDVPGDPRNHYLPRMEWTPDGSGLLIQQLNRLQNTNRVFSADPTNGSTKIILVESDASWVENENPVRWLDNGQAFLWLSERDGWRHLYSANTDGKDFKLLTPGEWDVIEVEAIDQERRLVYFSASPENAKQRYLYRVSLDGGNVERLSPADQDGWHTYEFSPDAKWAIHTYSTFMTPPVVKLISLSDNQAIRVLTENLPLREKLDLLSKPTAEFRQVEIEGGVTLDAWCLKPPGFDSTKKYPLLFYVYGEPHGQTVKDAWPNQRGLWHWMLAQQGYVVVSLDNRGTMSPRGRAWRKVVYRQIGILASQEQAAAAQVLLDEWPFIDKDRVGIWGWSGGGSMSLNMIFRYPELYRTAIAVAPVAKQVLYDSIYQERYMGLPTDNADGFRDGSPIHFAHQLKGNLLLVHGTADDNVHYQATEMLIDELIKHQKYFLVMPYPGRSHSISEGDHTVAHFYQTLTLYLQQHLLEPHTEVGFRK